jgi:hypothetical protein
MRWAREGTPADKKAKTYTIRPGSPLDVPKTILVNQKKLQAFEDALHDHYAKSSSDEEILIELYTIYRDYRDDGVVLIQSTHGKHIRLRHEQVVSEVVKANIETLLLLDTYFKKKVEKKAA